MRSVHPCRRRVLLCSTVLDWPAAWGVEERSCAVAGLAAAGVALVASAAVGLVKNICKNKLLQVRAAAEAAQGWPAATEGTGWLARPPSSHRPRCFPCQVLCTGAAVVAYYYPKPWTFPSLIVIGGLVTLVVMRKETIKVGVCGLVGGVGCVRV